MQSYLALKNLIETNQLKLHFVLSLPRTRSNAITLALTQAEEIQGQLSVPFFNHIRFEQGGNVVIPYDADTDTDQIRTFEQGCSKILARVKTLMTENTRRPVGLIINEHLCFITKNEMPLLLKLTNNIVITIRDPRDQFLSFLTRIVQDRLYDGSPDEKLQPLDALKMLNMQDTTQNEGIYSKAKIRQILQKHESDLLTSNDILTARDNEVDQIKQTLAVCWGNLKKHLKLLLNQQAEGLLNLVIVESDHFIKNVNTELLSLIKQLKGISFNSAMQNSWQKGTGENYHCSMIKAGFLPNNSVWNEPVKNSRGFTNEHDAIKIRAEITDFPVSLQEILIEAMRDFQSYQSIATGTSVSTS